MTLYSPPSQPAIWYKWLDELILLIWFLRGTRNGCIMYLCNISMLTFYMQYQLQYHWGIPIIPINASCILMKNWCNMCDKQITNLQPRCNEHLIIWIMFWLDDNVMGSCGMMGKHTIIILCTLHICCSFWIDNSFDVVDAPIQSLIAEDDQMKSSETIIHLFCIWREVIIVSTSSE